MRKANSSGARMLIIVCWLLCSASYLSAQQPSATKPQPPTATNPQQPSAKPGQTRQETPAQPVATPPVPTPSSIFRMAPHPGGCRANAS